MAAVSRDSLNGYYKRVYGDKQKPLPEFAILQEMFPYKRRAKTGLYFEEVVFVKRSQGVTVAGTGVAGTAYALNDNIPLQTANAQIAGTEIIMREQIGYGAIAAAEGAGVTAFGSSFDEVVLGIEEAHRFYLEMFLLYGQTSIGTIETVTADTATTRYWTITKATYAPGIWTQSEGMKVDAYDAVGGTKLNTNGPVYITTFSGPDPSVRQVFVTGVAADLTAIVATSVIVPIGSGVAGQVFAGLDKITSNTGSLFGINAATYGIWKGNTKDQGNVPATMGTFHAASSQATVRGGMGAMDWILSPYVWQDLCDDQAALRRYASETKQEFVNGTETIKFYGVNGVMTFRPHPMVKAGEAYGIQRDKFIRGGESDLTSRLPGANNDDFFHEIPGYAGSEIRNYSSTFLYCRAPARQVKIYNIQPRAMG